VKTFVIGLVAVAMEVLLSRAMCLGQSNDVSSFLTTRSSRLSGYRVAVVSTSPIWLVGSVTNGFAIEECRYWTDATGGGIPWPNTKARQPGDTRHCYTRFRLGQVAVSIPLPPIGLGFLGGSVAVACAAIPAARFMRRGSRIKDEPINPR
jgi:hypothetical protein